MIRSNQHSTFRQLVGSDKLALVGYHDKAFVRAKPTHAHAPWLQERIFELPQRIGGSGTNITDGLRVAASLLQSQPKGVLRRIWLLSDGEANVERDQLGILMPQLNQAYINVNTIGFGDSFDEPLLRWIASQTHSGQFCPVNTLRDLSATLTQANVKYTGYRMHRPEVTVFTIDCSPSMTQSMEGKRRIDVVVEALTHLLNYKQRLHA